MTAGTAPEETAEAEAATRTRTRRADRSGFAPDHNNRLEVDGQRQLHRRCPDGLVKQLVDRGLPFQLHSRVCIHPLSLCAGRARSAEGHGFAGLGEDESRARLVVAEAVA